MRLLACLLLFYLPASAQNLFPEKDSSIVKFVDLPSTEPFDTARAYDRVSGPYVYISSDHDIYRYFGYEIASKYRSINFTDYHILGKKGPDTKWVWMMRENKKAFTEIPVIVSRGHIGPGLGADHRSFFGDTVIRAKIVTDTSRWHTTGHGDCFARFTYAIYADNYYPALLMREWNHWGGCRAGGSWEYTLSFLKPAGIVYMMKNTILMDGNGHIR